MRTTDLEKNLTNIFMIDNKDKELREFHRSFIEYYYELSRGIRKRVPIDTLWDRVWKEKHNVE